MTRLRSSVPWNKLNSHLVYLDVSELPPPEPLAVIMDALDNLPDDYCLHVHHRRYPRLLYERIEQSGYSHDTRTGANESCEIFIWCQNNPVACEAARQATTGLSVWCE